METTKTTYKHAFTLADVMAARNVGEPSRGAGHIVLLPGGKHAMLVKHYCTVADRESWIAHIEGDPVCVLKTIEIVA